MRIIPNNMNCRVSIERSLLLKFFCSSQVVVIAFTLQASVRITSEFLREQLHTYFAPLHFSNPEEIRKIVEQSFKIFSKSERPSDVIAERFERDEEGSHPAHLRAKHLSLPPSRDLLDPPQRVHGLGEGRAEPVSHLRGSPFVARRRPGCCTSSQAGAAALDRRWTRLLSAFPARRPAKPEGRGGALPPGDTSASRGRPARFLRPGQLHAHRREPVQTAGPLFGQLRQTRVSLFLFQSFLF